RQRQRHAAEHDHRVPGRAKGHEQQAEDEDQGHWYHYCEPLAGRDQLLERAAVVDPVAFGYVHLLPDALLQLFDEATQVAITHVGGDHHPALSILTVDLVGPQQALDLRDLPQRHGPRARPTGFQARPVRVRHVGQGDRQILEGGRIDAHLFRQSHHDVEAAVALEQLAGHLATDRSGNGLLHDPRIQAEARKRRAVRDDRQQWQAGCLFGVDVDRALDLPGSRLDLFGHFDQRVQVVTEHLDRHIRTHPRNQLVGPHLDRLRELVVVAWQGGHCGFDVVDQSVPGLAWIGPLPAWLHHQVGVRHVRWHRVGGHLSRADPAEDPLHFRNLHQPFLHGHLHLHRLLQARSGYADRLHGEVALVQAGNELAAQARGDQQGHDDQYQCPAKDPVLTTE